MNRKRKDRPKRKAHFSQITPKGLLVTQDAPDGYDPRQHNYVRKQERLLRLGLLKVPQKGQVGHMDVFHDTWCAIYHGGYCNCDPDIQIRPA